MRWSWLGDRLAIDVANTVRRRGWRYIELITSPADLRAWQEHERGRLAFPAEVGDASAIPGDSHCHLHCTTVTQIPITASIDET